MRQPVGRDRRARGAQRLRRNLAAVERHAGARTLLVLAAKEVAVEDLEVEQGRETTRRCMSLGRLQTSLPFGCGAVLGQ